MASMNSASYEKLRPFSKGKFSPQQFPQLKKLAANTVSAHNSISDVELNNLLSLYKSLVKEFYTLETEIHRLIEEFSPHYMSIPGFGPIPAALINSGTESYSSRMVKHSSSQLRYVLINCCLLLIHFDMIFTTYYAKKLVRVIYALEMQGVNFNTQKLR